MSRSSRPWITGYQEILTDPSYAGQIITFTFPHIGNVGANPEDIEADVPHALGCIVRQDVTNPSSFRSAQHFSDWLSANNQIGISGVDTRALTRRIREAGAPNAVIAHAPDGVFDMPALLALAQGWPGLEGMDLAIEVTGAETRGWDGGKWTLGHGYAAMGEGARPHVVAIDYGAKHNIFRSLVEAGAKVTVVPAKTSLEDILALEPAGVF
ncbi:carbamoyl-phosphate synthase domain-containing protein, partial [Blastomonas sp. CCH8-E1]|uniref:carbamoyl-phosphate synthase domain-containing protein n=1 Tax=Blastomonas sp. CCH8-E1 TaxID=1768736 RepID=UPI002571069B